MAEWSANYARWYFFNPATLNQLGQSQLSQRGSLAKFQLPLQCVCHTNGCNRRQNEPDTALLCRHVGHTPLESPGVASLKFKTAQTDSELIDTVRSLLASKHVSEDAIHCSFY